MERVKTVTVTRTTTRIAKMAVSAIFAAFLLVFGSFLPGPAGSAHAMTIDFETDDNGAPLSPGAFDGTTAYDGFGVTISSTGSLSLFNSSCGPDFGTTCSGGDDDLGTGASFGTEPQGNVLVIQDPNVAPAPGDSGDGGSITFDFAKATTLTQVALLDNDNTDGGGTGIFLELFKEGVGAPTVITPALGVDNLLQIIAFGAEGVGIIKLVVNFPGSGAIASVTTVPVPAALPLLLSALAWLGWVARRKKAHPPTRLADI